ncbi:MAG: SusF/SusE family outer membrane protein [Prolixibacteraceae bacterium]
MKQISTLKTLLLVLLTSVTTFAKAQDYTELYLIGDAVSTGWNIGTPTPMVKDANNEKIFIWTGALYAGAFKISTFKGDWCDGDWLNPPEDSQAITAASYIVTHGCDGPDNKWLVAEGDAGTCKITVNLTAQTIVYEKLSTEIADATLASLTASIGTLSPDFDPATTTYSLMVPESTTSIEVNAETSDAAATVSGAGTIELSGEDKTVVLVVRASDGLIIINYTINIILEKEGELYSNVYLVGDATPTGWNIAAPTPMIQDETNPKIFTWEGALLAGEFKFSTFTGDWCDGDWLLAEVTDQTISDGDYKYTTYTGCAPDAEDFKWRVQEGEEGDYSILVDFETEIISIAPLETGIGDRKMVNNQFEMYPNPAQNLLTIKYNSIIQKIEIATMSGKIIMVIRPELSQESIDVSSFAKGVYLVKTFDENHNSSVQKLVVKE